MAILVSTGPLYFWVEDIQVASGLILPMTSKLKRQTWALQIELKENMGLSASVLGPAECVSALREHDPKSLKHCSKVQAQNLKCHRPIGLFKHFEFRTHGHLWSSRRTNVSQKKKEQIWSRVQSSKKLHIWQFIFFYFWVKCTVGPQTIGSFPFTSSNY